MSENEDQLNELETSVLRKLAVHNPELEGIIEDLKVSKRTYSGVGGFTDFEPIENDIGLGNETLGLNDYIIMIPSVPNGMGSVLFCTDGKPEMLEFFTYGSDEWYGKDMNFTLKLNT
ncbi:MULTISPECIES: hypothetical protein [unclassified Lentimonas]|uniref:hypothetical protein n=1 Tax=unclassified Lentimonas TaxID=2630993 RepID=UPI001328A233|nr:MULTISPECIES: hypothetical protein [unclassified Lentimonas]CAA6678064.1 Unannotated [Lentimonas sp. CC4]CAA6687451.1 Unannotated [Lentimonas sp. CC6]CAA7076349.1 Unannotated [Lentimonas sp. CC4]CAA7171993.1 Unannotated [Lentimonas sp. CC21]CAA7180677.1 Unannotated [Lentimonas sp. CC8]